ncbi:MAG: DUF896 domain-containing protein [Anaerovoracaceae bacterium]
MQNMITKELVDKINALARKSKTVGLSEAEKEEQHKLRQEYLKAFRANFKQQLENIEFVEDVDKKVESKKKMN